MLKSIQHLNQESITTFNYKLKHTKNTTKYSIFRINISTIFNIQSIMHTTKGQVNT